MRPFYVSIIYTLPDGRTGPHLGNHALAKVVDGAYYPMSQSLASRATENERIVWVGDDES